MTHFGLTLYGVIICLILASCSNVYSVKNNAKTIYLAQYCLEGTDTLILFNDSYFYYNDGEVFSEGHWSQIDSKTIGLYSNRDILENKFYQTEIIDTLEIGERPNTGYVIHYKLKYHHFTGDTCYLIDNKTLKFNLSNYFRE